MARQPKRNVMQGTSRAAAPRRPSVTSAATRAVESLEGRVLFATFVWDGGDVAGRIVADGIYGYAIEAINRAGSASVALRGYIEVDSAVRMVSVRREQ